MESVAKVATNLAATATAACVPGIDDKDPVVEDLRDLADPVLKIFLGSAEI